MADLWKLGTRVFLERNIDNRNPTIPSLFPRAVHIIVGGLYPPRHLHAHSRRQRHIHGGLLRHAVPRRDVHARQPPEHHLEPLPKLLVHPEVDDGVVGSVAHGQPVAGEPQVDDVGQVVQLRVLVAYHDQGVEGQPTEVEHENAHYHHLYHLQREEGEKKKAGKEEIEKVKMLSTDWHHMLCFMVL